MQQHARHQRTGELRVTGWCTCLCLLFLASGASFIFAAALSPTFLKYDPNLYCKDNAKGFNCTSDGDCNTLTCNTMSDRNNLISEAYAQPDWVPTSELAFYVFGSFCLFIIMARVTFLIYKCCKGNNNEVLDGRVEFAAVNPEQKHMRASVHSHHRPIVGWKANKNQETLSSLELTSIPSSVPS